MKTKIIPAILAKDFKEFKKKVKLVENDFGLLQIDAIDGQFVDNLSYYNLEEIQQLKTKAEFELHLMVNNPVAVIKQVNSPKISRTIFHFEPVKNKIKEVISEIKNREMKVGIALNPETPLSEVSSYLNQIDVLLLMTVNPGWSGQGFLESSYERIKELRVINQQIEIEVDGGVNLENAARLIESGVSSLAVGSSIFGAQDIKSTINSFKDLIK